MADNRHYWINKEQRAMIALAHVAALTLTRAFFNYYGFLSKITRHLY